MTSTARSFFPLVFAALALSAPAQFQDPGFEQGGTGWTMHCPELTWNAPSTAPYGGSIAIAIQATSADFPLCPSEDPEGGWIPSPRFYQTLPGVVTGDVVRFKFLARVEVGTPVPLTTDVIPYGVAVDAQGVLHHPSTDLSLSGGNLLATWRQFSGQLTVPELPAGQTFALGFDAHAYGGGNGVVHFDNMALVVQGSGARLDAKAWLDGAYVPSANLMRDDLRVAGLIPTILPAYTIAMMGPNAPVGNISIAPSVLAVTGPNAIVDWAWVELRFGRPDAATVQVDGYFQPYEVLARRYVLIQRDGDMVDLDGTSTVALPLKAGNCYVVVDHRNHLGTMSATPLALSATPTLFDTRSAMTPLYQLPAPLNGQARKVVGSTRTVWPGDVWTVGATPGRVNYTGSSNDRDGVLAAIGGTVPTNVVVGYERADVNMDGVVKYTGANNDRDIILQTVGGAVPTAVRYEQVP